MRILLFGRNGQIGWELQRSLAPLGEVIAVDRPKVDFSDLKGLREFTLETKPGLIVNAAAYTAVDKAESEPELAMRVNGEAPGVLAEAANKLDVGLVHYSTDYVFNGEKGEPYTEQDEPNPLNVYGATKLAGDQAIQASGCAHLILRTSWVYGARGHNFFLTILRLAQEGKPIRVIDDQVGCPTWCRSIAEATHMILSSLLRAGGSERVDWRLVNGGIYNFCAGGETSWFEFAKAIIEKRQRRNQGNDVKLNRLSTREYGAMAVRPIYSVLSTRKYLNTFDSRIVPWKVQLDDLWKEISEMGIRGKIVNP